MIDLSLLKNKQKFINNNFFKRGYIFDFNLFEKIELKVKTLKIDIDKLNCEYKIISKKIEYCKKNYLSSDDLIKKIYNLKELICLKKKNFKIFNEKLNSILYDIPNLVHKSVPVGNFCGDNVEIKRIYRKKNNHFNCVSSFEFDESNKYIDFNLSAKISGTGFVVLKDNMAKLYRALGSYMLDLHTIKHGYKEIYSPLMVTEKSMFFTGHLPKFYNDQFSINNTNLWLIPTAEIVLSNLVSNSILNYKDLPIKFVTKTPCFRKEKGKYGSKVKGMLRQFQFEKVELVQIVSNYKSYVILEELVQHAEEVLLGLDLSYRIVSLCSKDLGFTSSKTYDLDVWFPMRKSFIEVSSCSNTESFQSRRMNSRYKNIHTNKYEFVHLLNGSGVAIDRIFIAIIENYLDINYKLVIPNVLLKYMDGIKYIDFK